MANVRMYEQATAQRRTRCAERGIHSVFLLGVTEGRITFGKFGMCRLERDVQVYPAATTAKMFSRKGGTTFRVGRFPSQDDQMSHSGRHIYINRKRESAGRELRHSESANVTCHRPHLQTERIPHEKSVMTARSLATTLRLGEPGRHPPVKPVTATCSRELKQKQDTRKSVLFRSGSET